MKEIFFAKKKKKIKKKKIIKNKKIIKVRVEIFQENEREHHLKAINWHKLLYAN